MSGDWDSAHDPFPDSLDDQLTGIILPEFVRNNIGDWGGAIAFESSENGVSYTHMQVLNDSQVFAKSLIEQGFVKGQVLAVVLPNVPEYCTIVFGLWEAGLVASLINPAYTTTEITHQFHLCGIKAVITNKEGLRTVQGIDGVDKIILLGETEDKHMPTYQEMVSGEISEIEKEHLLVKGSSINTEQEPGLMLFSSGTTGLPKAVVLTHKNIMANALQFYHATKSVSPFGKFNKQEHTIGVLPFFHAFGFQAVVVLTMTKGAHTITVERFQPPLFTKVLKEHQPTFLVLVPPILAFLSDTSSITGDNLGCVHTVIVGGAPTPHAVAQKFNEKCSALLLWGYGLTELSPVSHLCLEPKTGSIGRPLPMTSVKVTDPNTGRTLAVGEQGEICVRGPQVMKGYFNNDMATQAMIDKDGWLHTGDWGYFNHENYYFVIDRLKDIIKVKGFQVSPTELENLLMQNDKILESAVIGIPDAIAGELPRAYVVAKDGVTICEQEIHLFIKHHVATFKQLKGGIEFVESIPRNPTGKILRKVLMERYKQQAGENSQE